MADVSMKHEYSVKRNMKIDIKTEETPLNNTEEDDDEDYDYSNEPTMFSCEICSASFVTRVSLARHMVLHDGETPSSSYTCTFCRTTFTKKDNLASHISSEHGNAKFSCEICGRNLSRRDHLKRHIRNVHPEYCTDSETDNVTSDTSVVVSAPVKYESPLTPETKAGSATSQTSSAPEESDEGEVLEHQDESPNPDAMLQITVDVEPDFPEDYDMENDMDQDNMLYQESLAAPSSPEDYDPITKINASLNGIRVDRKYQCSVCGASFMNKVNLLRHQTTHSLNRPHKCPMCNKGFVRKEHLTKHLSSVHSGMKFTCEFCGKDISRKDHLIRHIRNVHPAEYLGIPPELAQSQNLDLPLSALQASGFVISDKALLSMQPKPKKPYLTCDMCDETFTHIHDLHEHQSSSHSDIRRFKCNFCPKAFKRKEHLMKHEVLHTGEKNFSCDHCGKEFPRKDALQDHIRRIHGSDNMTGVEFPCNFCDKVFLQRPNLLRHMKNMHGFIVNIPPSADGTTLISAAFPPAPYLLPAPGVNLENVNSSVSISSCSSNSIPTIKTVTSAMSLVGVGVANCSSVTIDRVSFKEDVQVLEDSSQVFSCAHCNAAFTNDKEFRLHLNTHRH